MTVTTEAAAAADSNADAAATGADAAAAEAATAGAEDAETGGATPEEIQAVLEGAGYKLPGAAAAANDDDKKAEEEAAATKATEEAEAQKAADDAAAAEAAKEKPAEKPKVEEPKPGAAAEVREFTIDVEDANGAIHKISKVEDLPEDFEAKSNRQGLEILDQLRKLDSEKEKYESEQAQATEEADKAERVAAIQTGWQDEFKQLNITDKAEQEKVFAHMKAENDKRTEAKRPLLASIEDVVNSIKVKEAEEARVEAEKAAKEETRKKGAMVGGSSAPASSGTPVYKPGSATNAAGALRSMGAL